VWASTSVFVGLESIDLVSSFPVFWFISGVGFMVSVVGSGFMSCGMISYVG